MRDLINIINESENNPLTNKKSMTLSEYIQKQDISEEKKMALQSLVEKEGENIKVDNSEYINIAKKEVKGALLQLISDDKYRKMDVELQDAFDEVVGVAISSIVKFIK